MARLRGSMADERPAETRAALATLGVTHVVQHHFTDTRLHQSLNEIIAAIEEGLAEAEPKSA